MPLECVISGEEVTQLGRLKREGSGVNLVRLKPSSSDLEPAEPATPDGVSTIIGIVHKDVLDVYLEIVEAIPSIYIDHVGLNNRIDPKFVRKFVRMRAEEQVREKKGIKRGEELISKQKHNCDKLPLTKNPRVPKELRTTLKKARKAYPPVDVEKGLQKLNAAIDGQPDDPKISSDN